MIPNYTSTEIFNTDRAHILRTKEAVKENFSTRVNCKVASTENIKNNLDNKKDNLITKNKSLK